MVRSMTGYGKCEKAIGNYIISVEIKSVNHRYFECSFRIPKGYYFLEEKLKLRIQKTLSRGKVEVSVTIQPIEEEGTQVLVNHSLVSGYIGALRDLKARYELTGEISIDMITKYQDIFEVHRMPEDEDALLQNVCIVFDAALYDLTAMRETEGKCLREDVKEKAKTIMEIVAMIENLSEKSVGEYQKRLREKLDNLIADKGIDEQRILTEVAIFADKVDINEEIVRLKSHFAQLTSMIRFDQPIGRKLDFLVQEMNREINTIGSKAANLEISYLVVEAKAQLEKIREQIQNIE